MTQAPTAPRVSAAAPSVAPSVSPVLSAPAMTATPVAAAPIMAAPVVAAAQPVQHAPAAVMADAKGAQDDDLAFDPALIADLGRACRGHRGTRRSGTAGH
ncbi:hypothetical protein N7E02_24505 [Aliirhizobium terrae]|uniref:hypothetical protein n=1 Tax=Terrirhizobium terrae TaxID=2926709 RepID=UPI002577762A|nr:hypothetical protein [Rhizobium sp. CC-CFT758]WJH39845.1 hypothetical protein N7E02_24505 [Rhizobium sp. CC-CFT758]